MAATIHIMASTPNTRLLEIDTSSNAIYYEFFREPPITGDGFLTVPHLPGLGVELKKDLLEHYAIT